jgi:predicted nuclease of restriction endonuclease-like (RecB) superfamily
MRAFAEAWPDEEIVQQAVARLPWGHNVRLLDRIGGRNERLWYAQQAIEHGWSRAVLEAQIETGLHRRAGMALTNFKATLAPPHSDLAQQTLKDPYIFDFLTLGPDAQERDLERGLLEHVRDFLLELGVGFAFVGSQVRLEVGGDDFYVDLLFFHLGLRCFVVVELKTGELKPVVAEKASRRGRLYSIRGGDSLVTGAMIQVNVAGGVRDRLRPVRRARRRLAPARKPRRGDPRAPAAARRAQARQAPAAASPDRPRLLGRRLSRLVAMGRRARDREAGDRDRVAPPRLRSLLGLEVAARRTTAARTGGRGAHRTNGT